MPAEVSSFHPVGTLTVGIEKGDSSLPNGKAFWFDDFVTGKARLIENRRPEKIAACDLQIHHQKTWLSRRPVRESQEDLP